MNDAEALRLIANTAPVYYITGAIHSPEAGSRLRSWNWPIGWRWMTARISETSATT